MPFQVLTESTAAAAPSTTLGEPLTSVGETLSSILDEVQAQMAERADLGADAAANTARYKKLINWGYRHVCSIIDLKELHGSLNISIVADQDFYLIPKQVAFVKRMAVIDEDNYASGGVKWEHIDLDTYRELPDTELVTAIDEPRKWFRHRRMIVVWPTPGEARTAVLDFKVRPDDLVDDTDSPLLPQEFHEAIILAAIHRAEWALRMRAQSRETYNEMLTLLRPIINTDAEESVSQRSRLYVPNLLRRRYSRSRRRNRFGGF